MEKPYTDTDEKALAMSYAYQALVKTLLDQGVISRESLNANLADAGRWLTRTGEAGASERLADLYEKLSGIPNP